MTSRKDGSDLRFRTRSHKGLDEVQRTLTAYTIRKLIYIVCCAMLPTLTKAHV